MVSATNIHCKHVFCAILVIRNHARHARPPCRHFGRPEFLIWQAVWTEMLRAFHSGHVVTSPEVAGATGEARRRIFANTAFAQNRSTCQQHFGHPNSIIKYFLLGMSSIWLGRTFSVLSFHNFLLISDARIPFFWRFVPVCAYFCLAGRVIVFSQMRVLSCCISRRILAVYESPGRLVDRCLRQFGTFVTNVCGSGFLLQFVDRTLDRDVCCSAPLEHGCH